MIVQQQQSQLVFHEIILQSTPPEASEILTKAPSDISWYWP